MKRILCLLAMVAVAGSLFAADKPYTCSMKVGNPQTVSKTDDSGNNKNGGNAQTQTKTTRRKMTWPVTVSFRGKDFPSGVKLNCIYLGTTDGQATILGRQPTDVTLNEKGDFKVELSSPEAVMTKTKSRGRGRNSNTKSEAKGSRITGCVIQLLVGDEVVRSYATKPTWAKLARKNPLPEDEILKLR